MSVAGSVSERELKQALQEVDSELALAQKCAEFLGRVFRADQSRLCFFPADNKSNPSKPASLLQYCWTKGGEELSVGSAHFENIGNQLCLEGAGISEALVVHDLARSELPSTIRRLFQAGRVRSFAVVPIYFEQKICGWLEVVFTSKYWRWTREDTLRLERLADLCAFRLAVLRSLAPAAQAKDGSAEPQVVYAEKEQTQLSRLVQHGDVIVVRTNTDFTIKEIYGDSERVVGVPAAQILSERSALSNFIQHDDFRRLTRNFRSKSYPNQEISEEIRVINHKTGQKHWLTVRALPILDSAGNISGWEGLGLDISEKKQTERELIMQSKRVEALYEVSRALQFNLDSALLTLKALKILIRATNSDCGAGCLVDRNSGKLELVAAEGLSQIFISVASRALNERSLMRWVVDKNQGVLLDNVQHDARANLELARAEGVKATIMVPLVFEDQVLGAIVLFCRRANRYSSLDYELVEAASSQIALSLRQSESYNSEKRQANSLAALYKLSHELSRLLTPREIVEHAFPILQEEFACKRMWFGILNEQGTHLVGQGGFGPGVRGRLANVQIELELRHDFLDEAIRNKQPLVVKAGQTMECSGLNRIMRRLKPGTFIVVPLVSLNQVVGALVVEPAAAGTFFAQRKLPLLTNMAAEIATVILARRFESKMADADKMRMAGLLASGVAHNFNNLLQAVMGQASLIEMQTASNPAMSSAAHTILEAAGKGASLIKQLLNFTVQGNQIRTRLSLSQVLGESREFYRSILGSAVALEVQSDEQLEVNADYSQIQQVISNLLVNAKEAIGHKPDGQVTVKVRKIRLSSGEVHPELAPGAYARIDIEDNGVGMDSEKAARCFEPFFTTKNVDLGSGLSFQGSGLGLSSAYSIVRQHDGIITVRSELGRGTVFNVYLPLLQDSAATQVAVEETHAAHGPKPEVVLLALRDDLTPALTSALSAFGLRVDIFESREKLLSERSPRNHMAKFYLLDLDHLGANAIGFLRQLSLEQRNMRVLAYCADCHRWRPALSQISGVFLLEKPLRVSIIKSLLTELGYNAGPDSLGARVSVEKLEVGAESSPQGNVAKKAEYADENEDEPWDEES